MKRILIIGGTSKLGRKLIKKFIANKNFVYFTYYRNIKKAKLIESNYNKKTGIIYCQTKKECE
jgi:3-oxoacyl-[acyl-carrier protein] reductase